MLLVHVVIGVLAVLGMAAGGNERSKKQSRQTSRSEAKGDVYRERSSSNTNKKSRRSASLESAPAKEEVSHNANTTEDEYEDPRGQLFYTENGVFMASKGTKSKEAIDELVQRTMYTRETEECFLEMIPEILLEDQSKFKFLYAFAQSKHHISQATLDSRRKALKELSPLKSLRRSTAPKPELEPQPEQKYHAMKTSFGAIRKPTHITMDEMREAIRAGQKASLVPVEKALDFDFDDPDTVSFFILGKAR